MNFDLDLHAGWLAADPTVFPAAPRRCAIAGNPGAAYGNVAKLPGLLWQQFGLDLVDHWATATEAATAPNVDVVIILTDLGGGPIMSARTRRPSEVRVSSRATWSRVREALIAANQPTMDGRMYQPPPKRRAAPDPVLAEGPPVRRDSPSDPLDSLRDAVRLLVEQAQGAGLASIEVRWTADAPPTVTISRFVTDQLEVR